MSSNTVASRENAQPTTGSTEDNSQMLRRVAALMRRYNAPETPESYELLYSYLSGDPKPIASKVGSTLARTGTLADGDIRQISSELRKRQAGDPELYEVIGRHLEQMFASMDGEFEKQIRANSERDRIFQSTTRLLQNEPGADDLRMIITGLVKELGAMRNESAQLSNKLQDSKARVRKLRNSLARSRINELRDPLTGLGNRRHFDGYLARAIETASRAGGELCLVMADLDRFKRLNDTFGHIVGDDVIKMFAEVIISSLDNRLSAARYGGEEFAIVLPDTAKAQAVRLAEVIRRKLGNATLRTVNGKKPIGTVTASFGVAALRLGETPETLIARADSRLYLAKAAGRDQVVSTG
ncbi:diguanylate cyclase [Oricola sp.]|uniref:GGDEF domain-containing protein n=1 Tax=Oricola sp. TaxID=1979950 RepID=UPI003BAA55D7